MKQIDKIKMAEVGYIQMGEINLSICKEYHNAEHSACLSYENKLKGEMTNGTIQNKSNN
jgi:uncharacterized protein YqhQ